MRLHRWVAATSAALAVLAAAGGVGGAAGGAVIPTGAPQAKVTPRDNGGVISVAAGSSFLVALGATPDWSVAVGDQAIVSRVVNIMVVRGAQGVYRALRPGATWIRATGTYPCQRATPPCLVATRSFTVTVVVTPVPSRGASAIVQGIIEAVVPHGVVLRTPELRPVCGAGEACPQFIVAGRLVMVDLSQARFSNVFGLPEAHPALSAGEALMAAGSMFALHPAGGGPQAESVLVAQAAGLVDPVVAPAVVRPAPAAAAA